MKFGCTVRAEAEDDWGNHASVEDVINNFGANTKN